MEIKIIETVTTTKETSLIEKLEFKKDIAKNNIEICRTIPDRFPGFLIDRCNGYIEAIDEIIKLLEENELILK